MAGSVVRSSTIWRLVLVGPRHQTISSIGYSADIGDATDVFDRLYRTVGELIRQRREDLGLTQAQLAKRLGVTQPAVSAWQRGKDFPKDLLAVADALEIPREQMLAVLEAAGRANDKVEQAIGEQTLLSREVRDALVTIYRQLLSAATRNLGSVTAG